MDQPFSATVDSGGRATIKIRPRFPDVWRVEQVSIEMQTAPLGSTANLRKNGSLVSPMIPTADAAGGDPPITITASDLMTVEWAGCTPGDSARVFVVYSEVES